MTPLDLGTLIDDASSLVGVQWPLDRLVAVNPLLDRLEEDFVTATATLGRLLGQSLWPGASHLREAARRGLDVGDEDLTEAITDDEATCPRPATMLERHVGREDPLAQVARAMVAQSVLEALLNAESGGSVITRTIRVLRARSGWVRAPRPLRHAVASRLARTTLDEMVGTLQDWDEGALTEEFLRHFARLPGWSAWAKWNDRWSRQPHSASLTRRELLTISFAVDGALLEVRGLSPFPPESPGPPQPSPASVDRLLRLERAVHGDVLERITPCLVTEARPRWQVVTCIDARSEPLRRALEADPEVETFGFAGFFGLPVVIQPAGQREAYESLPALVEPSATAVGGRAPRGRDDGRLALAGTFAELTHEPGAMFALAEGTGWLGAPLVLRRSVGLWRHTPAHFDDGPWVLQGADRVALAAGALRGMGLTRDFAREVLLLGHGSHSTANTHFAGLECGACAGHAGGTNAKMLCDILNDADVRRALTGEGISIPATTRFVAGEHDTTREMVVGSADVSSELAVLLAASADVVTRERFDTSSSPRRTIRREMERRARDWGETRPEWGLANHAAFIVAPRRSFRGADLAGRSFLHSYDPTNDGDGSILRSVLAAPMVVAQWINAAYYYSTVAPGVLGAGDKTLLNPISDFGVLAGDDPDLRIGLPWQSVASGRHPWHLPVRLLVAIEAPLDRIADAVRSEPMVERLVEGEWIRLVGRQDPHDWWHHWTPHHGWDDR